MSFLPLLSTALLFAAGILAILARQQQMVKAAGFVVGFLICLLPINELSIAHYLRVIIGDLSPVTICLLVVYVYGRFRPTPEVLVRDHKTLHLLVGVTAVVFYPSALGVSSIDLYSQGYYPMVLAPALLAIFCLGIYRGWYFLSALIAIAWSSYQFSLMDSDNLWDYLIDPVLAIYCLFNLFKLRHAIRRPSDELIVQALLFTVSSFLLFAVFHAAVNLQAFHDVFIVEDGFIEGSTVLALFAGMLICLRRLVTLRGVRSGGFLAVTGFLAVFCFFGAGEEISWGQRILQIETPEFFKTHNKQQETGFHNLEFEMNGEMISVNKLVFGTGLALGMLIYLFVMTPLYRLRSPVAHWLDRLAVPMPRNYHIAGYLIVVGVVEGLVDSSRRGEMTEFAGSIIFLLNLVYPYNRHIYDKNHELSTTVGGSQ